MRLRPRSLVVQGWRQTCTFASPNTGFLTNLLSLAPSVFSDHSEPYENVSQSLLRSLSLPLPLSRMIAFAYAAPLPTPEDPPVHDGDPISTNIRLGFAYLALVWFVVVWLVCCLGYASMLVLFPLRSLSFADVPQVPQIPKGQALGPSAPRVRPTLCHHPPSYKRC
jgi:hypothetical protein